MAINNVIAHPVGKSSFADAPSPALKTTHHFFSLVVLPCIASCRKHCIPFKKTVFWKEVASSSSVSVSQTQPSAKIPCFLTL